MFVDSDENTTMNTKYYSAKITIYDGVYTFKPNGPTSYLQVYITITFTVYSDSFYPNLMLISFYGTDYSKELNSSLSNSTLHK